MNFKVDKFGWKLVKLGDVVTKKEENDRENAKNRFDRFLKVEHMDAGSLHLKRWSSQEAGDEINPTFYKIFRKGQILFPTRNPHLRRTALASFDGICGEKTLTLEPNIELINPEFIPHLFHSEGFYAHTASAIIGSTNPHCRWRDVASFEFLLPPKDQQAKLAELLWAMDEVVEKKSILLENYKTFYGQFLKESVSGNLSTMQDRWQEYVFGDLGDSFGGLSGKTKTDFGTGSPFITYMNIFSNTRVDINQVDYVTIEPGENQNSIRFGDILITGSSETPHEVGMASVVLDDVSEYYLNSFCFGFRLNDFQTLLPEYARYLMQGYEVRKFMGRHAQGSTRFNISKTTIKTKMKIQIPPLSEQKKIAVDLEIKEDLIIQISNNHIASKVLSKSFINQVFS